MYNYCACYKFQIYIHANHGKLKYTSGWNKSELWHNFMICVQWRHARPCRGTNSSTHQRHHGESESHGLWAEGIRCQTVGGCGCPDLSAWRVILGVPNGVYISTRFSSFTASNSLLSWNCYGIHHIISHPGESRDSRGMFQLMLLRDPPRFMAHGSKPYTLAALGRTPRIFSERSETLSASTRTNVPRRRERLNKDIRFVCSICLVSELGHWALSNHSSSERAQDVKKEKIDHRNVLQPWTEQQVMQSWLYLRAAAPKGQVGYELSDCAAEVCG